jgi:hypothetical protein
VILRDAEQAAGYYHLPIAGLNLSNGYYLLDFKAGSYVVKENRPCSG